MVFCSVDKTLVSANINRTGSVEEQSQELWVSRGKGFGKGLNTESNNTQSARTTVLAGVGGEQHCREEAHGLTQV